MAPAGRRHQFERLRVEEQVSFLDWTTVLLVPVYLVLVLTLARVSDQTWVTCPPCRSAAGLRTFSLIKMNVFINRSLPTRGIVLLLQTSSVGLILILLLHPPSHPPEPPRNQSPPPGGQTLSPQTSPKSFLCPNPPPDHDGHTYDPKAASDPGGTVPFRPTCLEPSLTKPFPSWWWWCASGLCPGSLGPLIHNAL